MLKVNTGRLLDLMFQRRVGVNALAQASGTSPATISQIVNGNRRGTIPTVAKLAEYFCVNPRELILIEPKGD